MRITGDSCCEECSNHFQCANIWDLKPINPYGRGESIQVLATISNTFVGCGNTGGGWRNQPANVSPFRHTAAKLRPDAGETVEDVSRFLDHSGFAVTSVYFRHLEGEQDKSWAKVAEAIGVALY